MATFIDVTRNSKQSAIFSISSVKKRMWQPQKNLPPETYLHSTDFDFTIGGHYGCFTRIKSNWVFVQATPSSAWSWYLYANVEVSNGHAGTTVIQNVLIDSMTGIPITTDYVDASIGSISGTFDFDVDSEIKYDVNELGTVVLDSPPYNKVVQYERSKVGQNATCKVVILGTTVQQQTAVSTAKATTYKFQGDITSFIKNGSLSGLSNLLIQTMTTNQISVPSYNHLNVVNSNFYAKHIGSQIDCKNLGTDDAFGDPAITALTMSSLVKLEVPFKSLGKINAFDISYPDDLTIKISGLDIPTLGYRQFTASGGSWEQNDTFKNYNITSNVGLGTIVTTGPYNSFPTTYKTEIIGSSLTANGDDSKYTRLFNRIWPFDALTMSLSLETQVVGGTGLVRIYSPTKSFNSYRYLELQVKSNTGTSQTDTVQIITQPNNVIKTYSISTSSSTYERKRIDLMMPNSGTTGIDSQDNPYPRLNPSGSNPTQERQNSDWYGVSRVSGITLSNPNISLQNIYLVADDQSSQSNFSFAQELYEKYQTDAIAGTTYLARRLWTQDTAGRNDEEFDVKIDGGTKSLLTINDFVNRLLLTEHTGWTASTSTASGSGRQVYCNSISGYACWLSGSIWYADSGSGTVQKDNLNLIQTTGATDCNVKAAVIVDEFDLTELVCDYPDPFGVYKSPIPILVIPTGAILRGQTHGQIVSSSFTPSIGETINLQLTSDGSNRGQGSTNVLGNYYTGAPRALSYKSHKNKYIPGGQELLINPMIAGKRYRTTFFPGVSNAQNLSADINGHYQHLVSFTDSNVAKLIITKSPTFSSFDYITTDVTNAKKSAVRWRPTTNKNEIVMLIQDTADAIKRYVFDNLQGGAGVATTLGTGTSPTLAIDKNGVEFHFFRTTDSGGSVKLVVISPTGITIRAAALVVTGNVADKGLAAYCRNNDIYLVYSHTTNGITVVRSYNLGGSFS